MIQVDIIQNSDEKKFIEDINYFLEKLSNHQVIDIKYQSIIVKGNLMLQAFIVYIME